MANSVPGERSILSPFYEDTGRLFSIGIGPKSPATLPGEDILAISRPLLDLLNRTASHLWQLVLAKQQSNETKDHYDDSLRGIREAESYCSSLLSAVSDINVFFESGEAKLANQPGFLLVGEAGQGKTHLLCDIAKRDMQALRPRLLLHGSHFNKSEPWSQIIRILGLRCSVDAFLGALEAAGQAYNCRILIFIDALNEGEGRTLWETQLAGVLTRIMNSRWLGIAFSVRSSYEEIVVPKNLPPSRLIRVEHQGFQEHEYEAVNRFFVHYGIKPTIPILAPEFTNPLFLKLFCLGVKARNWTQIPLGLRGITAIMEMFLDGIHDKLQKPARMNYDPGRNIVREAVQILVVMMAKNKSYWLERSVAVSAVNQILPVIGYDNSLFRNLVSEGVLIENQSSINGRIRDVVSFAYERFTDHLVAKHLLDESLKLKRIKNPFDLKTPLGKLFKDERNVFRYAGMIEALCIQIPESTGKELYELITTSYPHTPYAIVEGFIKSLVWRDSKAFSISTYQEINRLLHSNRYLSDILDACLTVAVVPDHPLNAEVLHLTLWPLSLANRDAWWSTFLHHEWERGRALNRLIDWLCDDSNKTEYSTSVTNLTGITLTWFLTSSNRFVRDLATKALIKLYDDKLDDFTTLIDRFWEVNDPYVLERLLAVGYGCTMRSRRTEGMKNLSGIVASHVFIKRKLQPDLLARDYARGIIECTRHRGLIDLDAFPERLPPYRSKWPSGKTPTEATLTKWVESDQNKSDAEYAKRMIYSSIVEDYSDFSRYVLRDFSEWTNVSLKDKPPKPFRLQYHEFLDKLTASQKRIVEDYLKIKEIRDLWHRISNDQRTTYFGENAHQITDKDIELQLAEVEKRTLLALKTSHMKKVFKSVVIPYIENPSRLQMSQTFDRAGARRWMVQRVIDYGWTVNQFGNFDRSVVRYGGHGRETKKPERIGKKYQWIAYHELLARLSDNFHMRERYSEQKILAYSGPWSVGYGSLRDIDPSVTLSKTQYNSEASKNCWWSSSPYVKKNELAADIDWLQKTDDLPDLKSMLEVRSPAEGISWLVLDSYVDWRQPEKPGRTLYEQSQRLVRYFLSSYLVRRSDAKKFFNWAKRQNFMEARMPESNTLLHIHLGEYPWAPSYRESDQQESWQRGTFDQLPVELQVTTTDFLRESSGYDCSVEESIRIKLPSAHIINEMRLLSYASEGEFFDTSGNLIAFDPSVKSPGPGALLFHKGALQQYLEANDLVLFWTVCGEKQLIGGDDRANLGWMQVSGAFQLNDQGISGHYTPEYRTTSKQQPLPKKRSSSSKR